MAGLALAVLAAAALFVVIGAAVQALSHPHPYRDWLLFMPPLVGDVFVAFWSFFIGASIGSFLNVVAWRMPRGRSINGRSHCPRCELSLSWRDNLPVVGWLALGGRCRGCRLPISPRYPLVEAAVGVSIAWVVYHGLQSAGTHLPYRNGNHLPGSGWQHSHWLLLSDLFSRPLAVTLYHAVMLANLWALALVRADGSALPGRLVAWCAVTAIVPLLAWPELVVVPWTLTSDAGSLADGDVAGVLAGDRLGVLMQVVTATAAAVVLSGLLGRSYACCSVAGTDAEAVDGESDQRVRRTDLCGLLAFAGIIVGWQALLPVTAVACLLGYLLPTVFFHQPDRLARLALALPLVVAVQLTLWGQLHEANWWLSVDSPPENWLIWIAMLLALSRLAPLQAGPYGATCESPE